MLHLTLSVPGFRTESIVLVTDRSADGEDGDGSVEVLLSGLPSPPPDTEAVLGIVPVAPESMSTPRWIGG